MLSLMDLSMGIWCVLYLLRTSNLTAEVAASIQQRREKARICKSSTGWRSRGDWTKVLPLFEVLMRNMRDDTQASKVRALGSQRVWFRQEQELDREVRHDSRREEGKCMKPQEKLRTLGMRNSIHQKDRPGSTYRGPRTPGTRHHKQVQTHWHDIVDVVVMSQLCKQASKVVMTPPALQASIWN